MAHQINLSFPFPVAHFSEHLAFTTLESYVEGDALARFDIEMRGDLWTVEVFPTDYQLERTSFKLAMFDVDEIFQYAAFSEDHGPLNIAMVVRLHHLLQRMLVDENLKGYKLVLYTLETPDFKSNAACLAAIQALLANRLEPWRLICHLAQFEFKPFRDAAKGRSEWCLSIQDVLWGSYRAQQAGLLDMKKISPDEYEKYELPQFGDLNTIGPFVPFASPRETAKSPRLFHPRTQSALDWFERNDVRAVVRLNDALYDATLFTNKGIAHLEMEFPDGTNPPLDLVRKFIGYVDRVIKAGGKVAVHCKAGLGRSGVMIGAYLIYKYGFAANEAIGLMRLIRPGMVVGPQQGWLVDNAAQFIRWSAVDEYEAVQASARMPLTPPRRIKTGPMQTPAQPRKTPGGFYTTEDIAQPAGSRVRKGSPLQGTPVAKRFRGGPPISPMKQLSAFMSGTKPLSPQRSVKPDWTD